MDRFYLENASQYQKLVDSHDAAAPKPHFSRHKAGSRAKQSVAEQFNKDMVTSARVRPMLDDDIAAGFPRAVYPRACQPLPTQIVDLHDLYNHPRGMPILKSSTHQLDRVFDSDTTTDDIYLELVADLVTYAQHGGIGTLFAYGQTGSGKTYTISKLQKLAVTSLLDKDAEIFLTIADLAGKSAFDLLQSRKPTPILEDANGDINLGGIAECRVSNREEVDSVLDQAAAFRCTAPTLRNDSSSRSHSICRIRIKCSDTIGRRDGLLYLVDLAGSEAARDVVQHGAERMRETKEINMSLSVLKDCVRGKCEQEALCRTGRNGRNKVHVPIRQSTLTKVLKHVFDTNQERACRTVMIACINPSLADVGPSKNTLRYTEMLRGSTQVPS